MSAGSKILDMGAKVALASAILACIAYWSYRGISGYYALRPGIDMDGLVVSTFDYLQSGNLVLMLHSLVGFGVLYLFYPVLYLTRYIPSVYILQAAFVAAPAVPLYALARKNLGPVVSLAIGLAYLVYPGVQGMALDGVHYEPFFILPFVSGVCLYSYGKKRLALVALVFSEVVRLQFIVFGAAFGAYLLIAALRDPERRGELRMGLVLVGVAFAVFCGWILTGPTLTNPILTTPAQATTGIEYFLDQINTPSNVLTTLFFVFLPVGFIALLSKTWLPCFVPFLLLTALDSAENFGYPLLFQTQYPSAFVAFLFLGLVEGAVVLKRLGPRVRLDGWRISALVVGALVLSTVAVSPAFASPLAIQSAPKPDGPAPCTVPPNQVARLVAMIPPGSRVVELALNPEVYASRNVVSVYHSELLHSFPSDANVVFLNPYENSYVFDNGSWVYSQALALGFKPVADVSGMILMEKGYQGSETYGPYSTVCKGALLHSGSPSTYQSPLEPLTLSSSSYSIHLAPVDNFTGSATLQLWGDQGTGAKTLLGNYSLPDQSDGALSLNVTLSNFYRVNFDVAVENFTGIVSFNTFTVDQVAP